MSTDHDTDSITPDRSDDGTPDDGNSHATTGSTGEPAPGATSAESTRRTLTIDTTPVVRTSGAPTQQPPTTPHPTPATNPISVPTVPPPPSAVGMRPPDRGFRRAVGVLVALAVAGGAAVGLWAWSERDRADDTAATDTAPSTTIDPAVIAAAEVNELLGLVEAAESAAADYDTSQEAALEEFDGHWARCSDADQCAVIVGLWGGPLITALEDASEEYSLGIGATLQSLVSGSFTDERETVRSAAIRHHDARREYAAGQVRLFAAWLDSDDPFDGFADVQVIELNTLTNAVRDTRDELCEALDALQPQDAEVTSRITALCTAP